MPCRGESERRQVAIDFSSRNKEWGVEITVPAETVRHLKGEIPGVSLSHG